MTTPIRPSSDHDMLVQVWEKLYLPASATEAVPDTGFMTQGMVHDEDGNVQSYPLHVGSHPQPAPTPRPDGCICSEAYGVGPEQCGRHDLPAEPAPLPAKVYDALTSMEDRPAPASPAPVLSRSMEKRLKAQKAPDVLKQPDSVAAAYRAGQYNTVKYLLTLKPEELLQALKDMKAGLEPVVNKDKRV